MAPQHENSITSYFQPGQPKAKDKKPTLDPKTTTTTNSSQTIQPKPETKAKGKRPMSSPPPAPSAKRPNKKDPSCSQRRHYAYNDLDQKWLDDPKTLTEQRDENPPKKLQLTYHKGDMFEGAPDHCLLIHACNTQGHWGAGIAKAFKTRYPKAYAAHNSFCAKDHSKTNPVPTGTSQLLTPVDTAAKHWIGCVFTSARYGKAKDKPDAILRNTAASMKMLLELVKMADEEDDQVTEIRMCKINSGMFGVPWERTEEALQSIVLQTGWRATVEVWEP
tara:strand:- start:8720 stop:9547 length:828 start_codon:yes stop_codon:yes gene_type:complete